ITISHSKNYATAMAVAELLPDAHFEVQDEMALEYQEENLRNIN
ncbi:MAG: hypothetical protein K0Q65_810, partial [Clostridia bacterium]|nr:hypothetical protein [Clostridia bacterium]